ncbi:MULTISPECIES: relaxase/mobilization nuclease domain-containing protein [unclassified Ruminococcus]|uniref:relaxase/mobilization nuclease domain-containing protein n=1 Tax=unclassified Ruminococcus TaxID=2608920 RepID=UPI000931BF97|nr:MULTISPECIES: relaxase/mobilization nuclease domain-containing protein [unclassified Ruminococcus]
MLIGQELCKTLFNDEYQYILAVHVDHSHVHNHIIVNNVNFYTGKTFETEHNQGKKSRPSVEQTLHDFGRILQKARAFYHRKPASFKG